MFQIQELKKVFIYFITLWLLSPTLVYAEENIAKKIETLFTDISSLMNNKKHHQIRRFFKYYFTPEGSHIRKSMLVELENPDNVIDTQELKMSRDEFVEYTLKILKKTPRYSYKFKINNIEIQDKNTILVSLSTTEEATSVDFDPEAKRRREYTVNVSSSCNFNIKKRNSAVFVNGSNCIERITIR